ncbi:MAG: hypothetical protein U5N26_02055 [Candidatus Marinimicrobia bacterium]|nr:hypothetical protein [Candidatus Neomarinimicrobiota bacterium]
MYVFRREGFEALPVCMQKRIVRRVFEERLKETRHVSRKQLEQVLHFMLYAGTGRSTELLGHRMIKERERVAWPSGHPGTLPPGPALRLETAGRAGKRSGRQQHSHTGRQGNRDPGDPGSRGGILSSPAS